MRQIGSAQFLSEKIKTHELRPGIAGVFQGHIANLTVAWSNIEIYLFKLILNKCGGNFMLRTVSFIFLVSVLGCKSSSNNSTPSAVVGESGGTTVFVYGHSFKVDDLPKNIVTYEDDYGALQKREGKNALCLYRTYVRPGSKLKGNKRLIMEEARSITARPIEKAKFHDALDVRYHFLIFPDGSLIETSTGILKDHLDEANDDIDDVAGKRGHRQRDLKHPVDWDALKEALAIAMKFEAKTDDTCPTQHPGIREKYNF